MWKRQKEDSEKLFAERLQSALGKAAADREADAARFAADLERKALVMEREV